MKLFFLAVAVVFLVLPGQAGSFFAGIEDDSVWKGYIINNEAWMAPLTFEPSSSLFTFSRTTTLKTTVIETAKQTCILDYSCMGVFQDVQGAIQLIYGPGKSLWESYGTVLLRTRRIELDILPSGFDQSTPCSYNLIVETAQSVKVESMSTDNTVRTFQTMELSYSIPLYLNDTRVQIQLSSSENNILIKPPYTSLVCSTAEEHKTSSFTGSAIATCVVMMSCLWLGVFLLSCAN